MIEYDLDRIDRLIGNARIALNECERSRSEWGIEYWSLVVSQLMRAYNRLN